MSVIAGIGLRDSATVTELRELLALAPAPVTGLATVQAKSSHPALTALVAETGLALHAIPPAALRAIATLTQSPDQIRRFGTGSLAEACALVAAQPNANLYAPRCISPSGRATIAFAIRRSN